jgi:hypothetical protein
MPNDLEDILEEISARQQLHLVKSFDGVDIDEDNSNKSDADYDDNYDDDSADE